MIIDICKSLQGTIICERKVLLKCNSSNGKVSTTTKQYRKTNINIKIINEFKACHTHDFTILYDILNNSGCG